jgi:type III pantothenate kinase
VILAVDCGNTRIKWGLHSGSVDAGWRQQGTLLLASIDKLNAEWASLPAPRAVVIANVAGAKARDALSAALERFAPEPVWVVARQSQCGVTNAYDDPAQLGADRWSALIGARQAHAGASLVVNAGTATTVDLLSASGLFRGGVILPGLELMKQSLAAGTAGLPLGRGEFTEEPRSTADAIETGCLLAQAGAIEQMYRRLEPGALCLLSGGAALRIAARLAIPVRVAENIVLDGLVRIAMCAAK